MYIYDRSNRKYCPDCVKEGDKITGRIREARPECRAKRRAWRKAHSEYMSVCSHHNIIFKRKGKKSYKGMPFSDGWNPDKGGSYKAAEQWIINNLGRRPKGTSLHIVEQEKGFVPGNLEWTHRKKQNGQQMFKIIADLKHRIKELETYVKELENR